MTVHEEYQSLTLRDINRRYSWDEEEEAATNVTISEYREIIMKEDQVDENHANLLKQDRRDTFNRKYVSTCWKILGIFLILLNLLSIHTKSDKNVWKRPLCW